jgi:Predicted periplasmic ligand-binding sensor domain
MEPAIGTRKRHLLCSVIVLLAAVCCKTINRLTKSLLLLTGFLTGPDAHGQEYTCIHYDVKDGLAGSTVYDLCQDKDGFLWFATDAGVCRFDGSQFRRFTTADDLPEIEVVRLFADSKGRVWMAPFKNSLCYFFEGIIHNQYNDRVLQRLRLSSGVVDFAEGKNGHIAFTTSKNGFVIRSDTVIDVLPRSIHFLDVMMLNVNPAGPGFQFFTIDSVYTFVEGETTAAQKNPFPSPFVQNRLRRLKYPPLLMAHSMMPQRDKVVFVNTYKAS